MDRIIIQNRKWSRTRYEILRRAISRMERVDYPQYNFRYFARRLKLPTIDLDDGPARYLSWTFQGSLFVPLAVAEREPWRMVQETMLQQMVHQYLIQVLGLPADDPRHARAFRDFCEAPHVRLALSMTYGLPGFAAVDPDPAEQRLYQRIVRLLALSESPNAHEAAAALREAQRLMLKHNIDLSLRPDRASQRYGLRHLGRPLQTVNQANRLLSWILGEHFFVKYIWVPTFDARTGKEGSVLEVCGTPANLDMADHVYHFLKAAGERLWREHRAQAGLPDNRGQAEFTVGVLTGFRQKLWQEKQRNQVAGLVWLGDKGLDDFYQQLHPSTRPLDPARAARMGPAMRAGIAAGGRLELHRPVRAGDAARAEDERSLPGS